MDMVLSLRVKLLVFKHLIKLWIMDKQETTSVSLSEV